MGYFFLKIHSYGKGLQNYVSLQLVKPDSVLFTIGLKFISDFLQTFNQSFREKLMNGLRGG